MARTDEVADQAIDAQEVSLLTKHAFSIAQAFHGYYQKPQHSILHAASDDVRACRVLVVEAFLRQMAILTRLLGIPLPEKM
jgi:arginyl-tRNA synthetase